MASTMEAGDISRFSEKECRLVVVGRSGSGKSSVVNTILGKDLCPTSFGAASTTSWARMYSTVRLGKEIRVVDTPGLFDSRPQMTNDVVLDRLATTALLLAPGPHAILMTLALGQKYSEEEKEVVKQLRGFLGQDAIKHTIIVFTRGDDLEKHKKTIAQYVEEAANDLKDLLVDVGHRYVVFNNATVLKHREASAKAVLGLVEKMVRHNATKYYSADLFAKAEEEMKHYDREVEHEFRTPSRANSSSSLHATLQTLPGDVLETEVETILKKESELKTETDVKGRQKEAGKDPFSLATLVSHLVRMVSRRRLAQGMNHSVIANLVQSPAMLGLLPLLPAQSEEKPGEESIKN